MKWFLKNQLKKQGADKQTADALASLASKLDATVPHLDQAGRDRIAQEVGFRRAKTHPALRLSTAGAFAAFIGLVVIAQSAAPGSALYALKRGSEEVLVKVQPSFQQTVETRRRVELEDLKQSKKAEKERIKEAEKAYKEAQKEAEDRTEDIRDEAEDRRKEQVKGHKSEDDASGRGSGGSDDEKPNSGNSGRGSSDD